MALVTAAFPSHSVSFGPGLAFSPQLAHKINSCPKVDVARPIIKFVPIHVNNIDPSSGSVKRQAQSGPAKKRLPHTKPISGLGAFRAGGHVISTGPDNEGWRTIIAHPRLQAKRARKAKLARLALNKQPRFKAHPISPASAGPTKLQRPVGLRHISLGMLKSATRQARPPEYDRLHSLRSKSSCHDLPTISKATGMVPSNAPSSKVVTGTSGRNKPQKSAKRNSTSVDHGGKRHGGTSAKVGQGGHEGMSRKRGSGGAEETSSESEAEKRAKEKKTPAAKKRKTEGKKRVGKKLVNMDWEEALRVMTPETSKGGTIKLPFNFMSPHLGRITLEDGSVRLRQFTDFPTLAPLFLWYEFGYEPLAEHAKIHVLSQATIDSLANRAAFIDKYKQNTAVAIDRRGYQLEDLPPALRQAKFGKEVVKSIFYKKSEPVSVELLRLAQEFGMVPWALHHYTETTKVDQAIYGNPAGSFVHIDRLDPTMAKAKVVLNNCQPKTADQAWSTCQAGRIAITKLWCGHEAEDKEGNLDRYCEKAAQAAFARKVFEPLALTFRRQYDRAMENWRDITIILDKLMPSWDKPDEEKTLDAETVKADVRRLKFEMEDDERSALAMEWNFGASTSNVEEIVTLMESPSLDGVAEKTVWAMEKALAGDLGVNEVATLTKDEVMTDMGLETDKPFPGFRSTVYPIKDQKEKKLGDLGEGEPFFGHQVKGIHSIVKGLHSATDSQLAWAEHRCWFLCDSVGLGKTMTATGTLAYLHHLYKNTSTTPNRDKVREAVVHGVFNYQGEYNPGYDPDAIRNRIPPTSLPPRRLGYNPVYVTNRILAISLPLHAAQVPTLPLPGTGSWLYPCPSMPLRFQHCLCQEQDPGYILAS
ncbi:hypothetical protein BT69DRAFT_1340184 [Atractiella rhizophila]|nr:hypothetical protein BT69DRAFT_1340184 [Atractiella rhizophila]